MIDNFEVSRREVLRASAGLLAAPLIGFGATPQAAAARKAQAGWPMASGPDGNFFPRSDGHELVDDLAKARLVWISFDRDLGYGKGTASGYIANLATWPGHPGSCSSPIVGDGRVFCSSFRPSGGSWAENLPHLKHEKNGRWFKARETTAKLKQNLCIEADDLLLAVDFRTGKMLWKAVETGKGLNRYMGKREGFAVSPAFAAGRVFSMGSTGRLYAYDAASGKKLWETHIGPAYRRMQEQREKSLKAKTLPKDFGWDVSLVVAGGVLIVPLFEKSTDTSLRGVDVRNGKTLWEIAGATSRYGTPALYRHEKREYLLTATRKGQMHLIDPRNGKIQWSVSGLQPTYFSLTPKDGFVLVNAGSKSKHRSKRDLPFGLPAAYRISPKGAKRLWTMPDKREFWFENHMDSCARRKFAIHHGHVYYFAANKAGGETGRYFAILNQESGKVVHTEKDLHGPPLMYPIEDRLLYIPDAWHSDRMKLELYTTDPRAFKQLGSEWKPPHTSTTGYEVSMEIPCVDGRIIMRTRNGDVRCYDLRKAR